MSTGALTSGCSLTRTWCVPTVLIGSRTSIRRRSSSGPPASRTAAAMSAGPTETAHFVGEDELHRCTTHVALLLARRARVRKQRHLAGVLDRRRDVPLVAGAVAGHPPGADLAAV